MSRADWRRRRNERTSAFGAPGLEWSPVCCPVVHGGRFRRRGGTAPSLYSHASTESACRGVDGRVPRCMGGWQPSSTSTTSCAPRPTGCSLRSRACGDQRVRPPPRAASIDDQPVIRKNRDTLYSGALVDISQGATLTLPDAGDRYLSAMVVNNDHYINEVSTAPASTSSPSTASTPTTCLSRCGSSSTPTTPPTSPPSTSLQDQMTLTPIGPPVRHARLRHGQPRRDPRRRC